MYWVCGVVMVVGMSQSDPTRLGKDCKNYEKGTNYEILF